MAEDIYYFIDERGDNPVQKFIRGLPVKERAKVFSYLAELKKQKHNLRRPMADYLGNDIYELRPKDNRIFYFFYLKNNVVLLHAIKKKTKKIPRPDMDLCIRRKEQLKQIKKLGL